MSIDRLIKIAKSKPLPTEDSNLNEAEAFCHAFDIKQGRWNVRVEYIYKVYCDWAINPVNKDRFFKQFSKLLVSTKKDDRTVYKLNKGFYELGEKCRRLKSI